MARKSPLDGFPWKPLKTSIYFVEETELFVFFDAFPSGSPSHTLFIATIRIARANLPIRSKRKSLRRCHTERRNSKQTADESTFVQEKHEHLDSDGPALVLTCLDMSLHDSLMSLSESIGEWKPTAQECKLTTSQGFRPTAKNISHDARADNLVVGPRLKKMKNTSKPFNTFVPPGYARLLSVDFLFLTGCGPCQWLSIGALIAMLQGSVPSSCAGASPCRLLIDAPPVLPLYMTSPCFLDLFVLNWRTPMSVADENRWPKTSPAPKQHGRAILLID